MSSKLSTSDICAAIDVLTAKSQSCQGPANQINIINIALAVTGQGPVPAVIARLTDIIITCTATIDSLTGTPPMGVKSDEDAIVKSFTTFVQVHQQLQSILIGKAGLVPNLLPFVGPPLASVLRQLESVIDTLAYELIDLVPDDGSIATQQKDSLDVTLGQSIDAWNGGITV
ncbi:hypothetical protein MMC19_001524 [Ptychographa xylographoides]|nr:hypothetical protein [Ptychographa xylographoides]